MNIPSHIRLSPSECVEDWGTLHGKFDSVVRYRSLPREREFIRFETWVTPGSTYNVEPIHLLRNGDRVVVKIGTEQEDKETKTGVSEEYKGQGQFLIYTINGGKDKKNEISPTELRIYCIYKQIVEVASNLPAAAATATLTVLPDVEEERIRIFCAMKEQALRSQYEIEEKTRLLLERSAEDEQAALVSLERQERVPAQVFGAAAWRKYLGIAVEEPPLPPNIATLLRDHPNEVFVLIPSAPLTLRQFVNLIFRPKQGHPVTLKFQASHLSFPRVSYWASMTITPLDECKGKTWKEQQATMAVHRFLFIPTPLEVITILAAQRMQKGIFHFSLTAHRNYQWIRCQQGENAPPITLGGFNIDGLRIRKASKEVSDPQYLKEEDEKASNISCAGIRRYP